MPDQQPCPLKLLTTQKSRQPGSPSAASLSRMNRRGTALPPIFGRLTHITTSTEECSQRHAPSSHKESSRLVPRIEGIGNRYKTFKQGCLAGGAARTLDVPQSAPPLSMHLRLLLI